MTLLTVNNLGLGFGGVRALDDLSFAVEQGEILGIIGPNGAGKSTIFNILSRIYRPQTGKIQYNELDLLSRKPHEIAALGIARTFQNIELFSTATVLQNLLTACHIHSKTNPFVDLLFLPKARAQEHRIRRHAEEILTRLELEPYRHQTVATLPYGVQKTVELGRALATKPQLLLIDEPASGLSAEETDDIAFWIADINRQMGTTIVMIEHDMGLVSRVCSRVMAIADGKLLAMGTPEQVQTDASVISAYLGTTP